jgi:co-chaperonin GroES (HSP10)
MLKPFGDRVIIKVPLTVKKTKEGVEYSDLSREAKVIESNHKDIKKGAVVYYNPRGCINVDAEQTKKFVVLIVDVCDIYAIVL